MTLPTSGSISTDQVMAELRVANPARAYPLSLTDSDVLALAGKSGAPVTLPTDFYGKSSYVPMQATGVSSVGNTYPSSTAGGTAAAHPSVSVSNGSGGNTYAWSFMSGYSGPTLSNTTASSCTVSQVFAKSSSGSFDVMLQCVVNDNTGHSVTVTNIEASAAWGTGY